MNHTIINFAFVLAFGVFLVATVSCQKPTTQPLLLLQDSCFKYHLIEEPCEEVLDNFYRFEYLSSSDTSLLIRLTYKDTLIFYVVKKIPPPQFNTHHLKKHSVIAYSVSSGVSTDIKQWQHLYKCLSDLDFYKMPATDSINAIGAPVFKISGANNGTLHTVSRQISEPYYFYCGQIFLSIAKENNSRYDTLLQERSKIPLPVPY